MQRYFLVLLIFVAFLTSNPTSADDLGKADLSSAEATKRIAADIQYLASDELKGRQPGTPEMKLAEDYIIKSFEEAGLKPGGAEGSYLQPFDVVKRSMSHKINPETTHFSFSNPSGDADADKSALNYQQQFVPMVYKEAYSLKNLPVVFVGYGINADREHKYNDYRDIDVEGKVVVLIRGEPQQGDPNSVFDGDNTSRYSFLQTKVDAARRAKAAAIIMVNDSMRAAEGEGDELASPSRFGQVTRQIPFVHVKRAVLEKILAKTPVFTATGDPLKTIAEIESEIDETLLPLSQTIPDLTVDLAAEFIEAKVKTSNVVGIIEGEGPLANETIVIGAHYDHLGMGNYGSRSRDAGKAIHNGADDNATGTAAVMELARRLSRRTKKPARRVVFVCFTAEELGLFGSKHFVENPVAPLKDTIAMVNFDMIGYLRNDTLEIFGDKSAAEFDGLLNSANTEADLKLSKPRTPVNSDHMAFNAKKVPNLFFHTGLNNVFHTPDDDFAGINVPGVKRVIDYSEAFIDQLLTVEQRPRYVAVARQPGRGVRLGITIEIDDETNRIEVQSVAPGSVADKGGLKIGDQILSFNGKTNINSTRRLTREIQRGVGKSVEAIVDRDEKSVILKLDFK